MATNDPHVGGGGGSAAGEGSEKTVMAFVPNNQGNQGNQGKGKGKVKGGAAAAGSAAAAAAAAAAATGGSSTLDSEKTVMNFGTDPKAAKPAAPPAKPAADDGEKTVMNFGADPKAAPAAKPAAPAAKPADDDGGEKTVMAFGDSKPAAKPAAKADDDSSQNTIMVDPSLYGDANTSTPTNIGGGGDEPTTANDFFRNTNSDNTSNTGGSSSGGSSSASGDLEPGQMPTVGQRMNQYEIIRLLGEGGMGAVFLARDTKLGRRVAIKFLQSNDPELTKRFIIEARATARVEHENIVSIYEVGEWNRAPFMVLQFLQGQGLNKVIPRGKKMPVQRVVELMTPVLRALAYAHSESIVHRDLKPDNIFVTDGGVIKVLDFGIAKVVQGEDRTTDGEAKNVSVDDIKALAGDKGNMTRHGAIMGTMPYMSPEQWGNGAAIDLTTDIWAVGIMMYIMLSGKHPLDPLQGHELMVTGFLDEPTPSLKEKAPELPAELIQIIDKCLVKDKAQRWNDALALLRALEPYQPGRFVAKSDRVEESPYNGLASFQEEDAGRFFGRNRESAAMSQRLRDRPIMAVVGPSGIGKSSFVRAGLVPALKNSGEHWDIVVLRPGRTPMMSLANLIAQASATSANISEQIGEQQSMAERLKEEPGYLGTVLRRQARKEKKHLLLFVDQFEELYTLVNDQAERLAFTACLSAAADDPTSPMRVVVSIRSDFIDRCVEDPHFMNELSQGLFFMAAPTRDGMRDALVLPAEMAGYKFETDDMVNEMLDHLATTSGALPLLQFTADRLWTERDPSRRLLTEKSYRALGGISGALAAHADRVIENTTVEQKPLVRALMLRLVTPERTRAIVSVDDLKEQFSKVGDVGAMIDQFVAARLLVIQTGSGGTGSTVELVHESLINGWPQLSRWLDEGHEDAAFLEQLRNASRQWAAKGKDTGLLWRGEMVEETKRFIRRFRGNLPDVQQSFLKAVIDQSTRAARVKKTLYVVGAAVLGLMLAAAAVALVIISESQAEAKKQAEAAVAAEKLATVAKEEAEKRKAEAETALNEARIAELAKDAARENEQKAMKEVTMSKEQLAAALVESKANEKKAKEAAEEATLARAAADQRAQEALEARNQATQANAKLTTALDDLDKRRREAEQAKNLAEKKLKEMTRGGIVEVLQ